MKVKTILDEDFTNYKKPSMVIAFPSCTWKCEKECGMRVCQNSALAISPDKNVDCEEVAKRYLGNPLTSAIVMAGLEPFDSFEDVWDFLITLRCKCDCHDDVVIYTGYTEDECAEKQYIYYLSCFFDNIIVKFGRFIPNQKAHRDDVLGVMLASNNQYGKRLA